MAARERLQEMVREAVREELAPLAKAASALGTRKEIAELTAAERAERQRLRAAGAKAVARYRTRSGHLTTGESP